MFTWGKAAFSPLTKPCYFLIAFNSKIHRLLKGIAFIKKQKNKKTPFLYFLSTLLELPYLASKHLKE